ncbi:MAG: carboxypeptidase M32 [Acidimicrobiales bacterium]
MATATGADLLERWRDISALGTATAVLSWDQETMMPPEGQPARGRVLSALAGMHHERMTDPALSDALEVAADAVGSDPVMGAQVRLVRREIDRARAVPGDLARRQAEVQSRAQAAWQKARAENDFSVFRDELVESLAVATDVADAYVAAGLALRRYDALIDLYEPGATEADIAPVFAALREQLVPIVAAVADSGVEIDLSPVTGGFDVDAQKALAEDVIAGLGYEFSRGRLDPAAHPFSISFGTRDVRVTWRAAPDDVRMAIYSAIHEAGHALYEMGLPEDLEGTPAGSAVSLGIHESQSRLWENLVGRRLSTVRWMHPRFVVAFPDAAGHSAEDLWRALNVVKPSLIRVEADEATYNLHIMARFELERALMSGDLAVDDLPGAWDDMYDEMLGIRSPDVADGVLQDIHWSMGAFGYFPTYTLGNLAAAQLFEAARRAIGDVDEMFASGDFAPLLGWLRENVHSSASLVDASDLMVRATGRELAADDLVGHLRARVTAVYGIEV